MHENSKARYITCGIREIIPIELQSFMWYAVDNMPEPKDYLQVFKLVNKAGVQQILHTSEEPEYSKHYILTDINEAVTCKVYIIDDGINVTMLLAEEY